MVPGHQCPAHCRQVLADLNAAPLQCLAANRPSVHDLSVLSIQVVNAHILLCHVGQSTIPPDSAMLCLTCRHAD